MIKLIRPEKPQYLAENENAWREALIGAIEQFGSYKNIPKAQKESLTKHYRHDKVKQLLFAAAHQKCALCECKPADGGNYLQVEHFYPKSIYPEHCFSWENFLPACSRCNLAKSDFDTKCTAIINPYENNPKNHLFVSVAKLKGLDDKGKVTINEVKLNASRLIKIRTELMKEILILTEDIADELTQYRDEAALSKQAKRKVKLAELVERVEDFTQPQEIQSFFCEQIIQDDDDYLAAKAILAA